ncbi:zinc finger protein 665-like [Drosophila montana]|uniref:zinc finger protein 665-like n=1 Tax=Drosophila montana TaxID=40370 RepID=UPI00313E87CA
MMKNNKRKGVKCRIKSCSRSYRNGPLVRLFKFPSNDALRREWIASCGLPQDIDTRNAYLCDIHFEKFCFHKKKIRSEAVPTLHLPDPSLMPIDIPKAPDNMDETPFCREDNAIAKIPICRSFVDTTPAVEVCRACMTSSVALVDIFDDQRKPSLADMLNDCVASIIVQRNDELPQKICLSCICDLQTAFAFQRRCEESHQKLREKVNKRKMVTAINMEMPEEVIDIVRLRMEIDELLSNGDKLPDDQMEFLPEDECKANTPISIFSSRDVNTMPAFSSNQRQSSLLMHNTNLSNSEVNVRSELLGTENWELAEQDNEIGCSKEKKDTEDNIKEKQTELSSKNYEECTVESQKICNPLAVNEPGIDAKENELKCPYCQKAHKHKSLLKVHIRTHTGELPYQCPHCPRAYSTFPTLRSHIYFHGGKTTFQCVYCKRHFLEKAKYDEHTRYHIGRKAFKCSQCPKIFANSASFKNHIRAHSRIVAKKNPFICPHCTKIFSCKSILDIHIRMHTGERPYRCPHCPKAFIKFGLLRVHIMTHAGKVTFKCPHCTRYFLEKAKLDQHMRYHIGHQAYKCPHCPKILARPSRLTRHIRTHAANNSEINIQSELLEIENCELAKQANEIGPSKEIKDTEDNIQEKQTELSSKNYEECTVERQKICNPLAVTEPGIDAKEKKFKCPQCPKAYKCKSYLDVHFRKHTGEVPKYQCPHCPKALSSYPSLRSHITTHSGKTAYKCPYCRKYFLEKAKYDEHRRTHVGYNAYKCPHCPKILARASRFRTHILTHTAYNSEPNVQSEWVEINYYELDEQDNEIVFSKEENDNEDNIKEKQTELSSQNYEECFDEIGNPLAVNEPKIDAKNNQFKCPHCQKAFKKKCNLANHIRTHTGERPYRCPHCPKLFKQFVRLRSHIVTHADDAPFRCPYCRKYFSEVDKLDEHTRYHIGHKAFKCSHCPKIFPRPSLLKSHLKTHNSKMVEN